MKLVFIDRHSALALAATSRLLITKHPLRHGR
jgi:hypothetical protein